MHTITDRIPLPPTGLLAFVVAQSFGVRKALAEDRSERLEALAIDDETRRPTSNGAHVPSGVV